MSVAGHLSIQVDQYDARIRTFVPHYELMIATAAETLRLLDVDEPTIVDLGIGTGALAASCLAVHPNARIIGIDADPAMLEMASVRLANHPRREFVIGNFLEATLPRCAAIVACLSLHHVAEPAAKRALYAACGAALNTGGLLVTADCFPAKDAALAAVHRRQWLSHLEQTYSPAEAEGYLDAWAGEDFYFPLEDEMAWLRAAGLGPEVVWRDGSFAVIAARR